MESESKDKIVYSKLVSVLTDVGRYSYSALCCVALTQLMNDDQHKDFNIATIRAVTSHICLPPQAATSIMAMLESACCDDPKPFADTLLKEECLKDNGLPVITDLVTLAVSNGHYDARMRVVIKYIAWQLRVSWDQVEDVESIMAETLEAKQYKMSEEEQIEKKKKSRNTKVKRFALIGLATIGGGAIVGLTGGLAAPLVAAGAASIIGGAGAAALGSVTGVAIIGSLFGVAGAGLTGYKMKKRVGAIEEFEFETLVMMGKQLHITIAITGWLSNDMQDFKIPWQHLAESREQYTLRWESRYLLQLGTALDYVVNGAMSIATQEALKYTILSGLISAIAWPSALLSVAGVIDNPWSVCIHRATAAGKALAEVLLAREQGNRPVTLVGYSLGSRVIFSCLDELSKRKGCHGIIEDVLILGAPVTGNAKVWSRIGMVVAGKIINGYSRGDWLLKFLFRTVNVEFNTVAGLGPIKLDNRRMHNIDLSDVVSGHKDYFKQLPTILKVVGIRTKDDVVMGQVPAHKLFPRTNSCESFTSSEEEDDISKEEGLQQQNPENILHEENVHRIQQESDGEKQDARISSESGLLDKEEDDELLDKSKEEILQEEASGVQIGEGEISYQEVMEKDDESTENKMDMSSRRNIDSNNLLGALESAPHVQGSGSDSDECRVLEDDPTDVNVSTNIGQLCIDTKVSNEHFSQFNTEQSNEHKTGAHNTNLNERSEMKVNGKDTEEKCENPPGCSDGTITFQDQDSDKCDTQKSDH